MLTRKKVWIKILVSYLLVMLLPVIIGGFMYQRMEQVLVEHANRANIGLLEQARQSVDSRIKELDQIILQIALDPSLRWLVNNAGNNYEQDQLRYIELMGEISRFINVSDFIDSLHFHFRVPGTVLTSGLKTDERLYYERIQNFEQVESMPRLLSNFHFRTIYPAMLVNEGTSSRKMVPYIQTYPLDEIREPLAALVILIHEQKLIRMLEQIEWAGEGLVYVLNDKNQIITSTPGTISLSDTLLNRLASQTGSFTYDHDNRQVMVSSVNGTNGWKYVSIVPKSIVMKKVDQIKLWSIVLFLLYIVTGIGLACILTYRNYKPVREVVNSILNRKNDYGEGQENEYDLIKNAVIRSIDEEQSLRQTLYKQMPAAKANLLTRLLKGHARLSDIDPVTLRGVGVSLEPHHFRVVLIEIENCQHFTINDSEQEWALVRFVFSNLLDEWIGRKGFIVELERNRLGVLLCGHEQDEVSEREAWLEDLKSLVEKKMRIQFTAAVSSTHEGPDGIGTCYTEALMALEYRVTHGSNSTIYFSDHKSRKRFTYYYPMEYEVQIINFIQTGDFDSAEKVLNQVYEINFGSNPITPNLGRFLFQELVGTFFKVIDMLEEDKSDLENEVSVLAKSIVTCATAEEMQKMIIVGLRLICDTVIEDRTDHRQVLYTQMVAFIEKHYHDSNLSLTMIADHFQLTPPYMSAFFKKQNGVNLSEYITLYRIEIAKSLLVQTDLTIGEISRKVGYANHIGFGRVFKKWQGITPGQYRETNQMLTPVTQD